MFLIFTKMSCYSCQNSSTASQANALKIEQNVLGDTLNLPLLTSVPPNVSLLGTSVVTLLVKSLDTGLVQSIALTDFTNGNNFAIGVVNVVSNFAFIAGTYKLYLRITTGAVTETLDLNQIVVYTSL